MLCVGGLVRIFDNSGAYQAECIKILRKFRYLYGYPGDIILVSIRRLRRAIKKRRVGRRGVLYYSILVQVSKGVNRSLGGVLRSRENGVILLNKDYVPIAKRLTGAVFYEVRLRGYVRISLLARRVV